MDSLTADSREVLQMFAALSTREQKKVHRIALRKATGILVKEAKRNFRSVVRRPNGRNRWNNRTFSSGIKSSINREVTEGKVHIMGDFRLKFFEMGTTERYKRTGESTGKISASNFFRRARATKEGEIIDSLNDTIAQSIRRVNEQHRSR